MKCKICGKEFELKKKDLYVATDKSTGIGSAFATEEDPIYDTFDCPFCGCQNVMQERKRKLELSSEMGDSECESKSYECKLIDVKQEIYANWTNVRIVDCYVSNGEETDIATFTEETCSNCGVTSMFKGDKSHALDYFCPACGADMKGVCK